MRTLAILFALTLSACASVFGASASDLDTAAKKLAFAIVQIETVANLAADLVQSGTLPPAHGRAVASALRPALDAAKAAQASLAAGGPPADADNALDTIERALSLALSLLSVAGNQSEKEISS